MVDVLSFIFGAVILGLVGWFAYNQISAIIKSIKKRKAKKEENSSNTAEVEKTTTNKKE